MGDNMNIKWMFLRWTLCLVFIFLVSCQFTEKIGTGLEATEEEKDLAVEVNELEDLDTILDEEDISFQEVEQTEADLE